MLEDTFLIRDPHVLGALFEETAVLATGSGRQEARGVDQIARLLAAMWEREQTYVADLHRVVQARDTALIVGTQQIAVVRRGADHAWRYALSFLPTDTTTKEEK